MFALLCYAGPALAVDWTYTVRPGDELWTIATRFCGSYRIAERIADYNDLAVARVTAGDRLRIPIEWLVFAPAQAEVIAVSGNTQRLDTDGRQHALKVGDLLNMGERVVTTDGSAKIRFADRSTIVVEPDSNVLLNKLTAFGPGGMVDTHLKFRYGRSRSSVSPVARGSRFRIHTPAGIAAVRGTDFRIGVIEATDGQPADMALTETLTGSVDFIADATSEVPAGYGLAASDAGVVKETLLNPPVWSDTRTEIGETEPLAWQALAGAGSYRMSIARTSDVDVPLATRLVTANSTTLNVPAGEYRVALRGISETQIEGFDAQRTLRVLGNAPQPLAFDRTTAHIVPFAWSETGGGYRFELSSGTDFSDPVVHETSEPNVAVPLNPGRYRWRVRDVSSTYSAPQPFTVFPAAPSGLRSSNDYLSLSVDWAAVPGADRYRLELSRTRSFAAADVVTQVEVPAGADNISHTLDAPAYGTYYARLVAVGNNLQSEPLVVETPVYRRPWWLLSLLIIPLLL